MDKIEGSIDKVIVFFETYQPVRHLLLAIVILVLGHWLVKCVCRWIERAMQRAQIESTVTRFVTHISHFFLLAVVLIIALGHLGVQTTSLLALLSAAGLAIGLALQGSLANLAAGLLLILFRPFKQGDYIAAAGVGGTVQDVQILSTTLHSIDNLRLTVPNSKITDGVITNYSVMPTRRISLTIGVSYGDDLHRVKRVLADVLAEDPLILKEPAPFLASLLLARAVSKLRCRCGSSGLMCGAYGSICRKRSSWLLISMGLPCLIRSASCMYRTVSVRRRSSREQGNRWERPCLPR